jgi:hypothetical protein
VRNGAKYLKANDGAGLRTENRPKVTEQTLNILENWRVCDGRNRKRALGLPQEGAGRGIVRLCAGEIWRGGIGYHLGRILANHHGKAAGR